LPISNLVHRLDDQYSTPLQHALRFFRSFEIHRQDRIVSLEFMVMLRVDPVPISEVGVIPIRRASGVVHVWWVEHDAIDG